MGDIKPRLRPIGLSSPRFPSESNSFPILPKGVRTHVKSVGDSDDTNMAFYVNRVDKILRGCGAGGREIEPCTEGDLTRRFTLVAQACHHRSLSSTINE